MLELQQHRPEGDRQEDRGAELDHYPQTGYRAGDGRADGQRVRPTRKRSKDQRPTTGTGGGHAASGAPAVRQQADDPGVRRNRFCERRPRRVAHMCQFRVEAARASARLNRNLQRSERCVLREQPERVRLTDRYHRSRRHRAEYQNSGLQDREDDRHNRRCRLDQ